MKLDPIVITDCDHSNFRQETEVIHGAGLDYTLFQCTTEDDLIRSCKGAQVMINQYAKLTARVLNALVPELKLIVRYGVGVDNIDVEEATRLGVKVCNVPDYGMNEVADHAAALSLSLLRKVTLMNRRTRGNWDYSTSIPIHRLSTLTVGVIGCGRIGSEFAKRMSAFGCRIIGSDIVPRSDFMDGSAPLVPFDTLVRESDLILIHCPLMAESRDLFSAETFDKMKPGAYLVNTARGGIVNEQDLYDALAEGRIAGAALDVAEREPLDPESPLFTLENFLCTPHMSWYSEEASEELKRKVAEEAVNFLSGKPLRYLLNGS
jgi:D-3-phosphoglycerate dehydrogenase